MQRAINEAEEKMFVSEKQGRCAFSEFTKATFTPH